MKRIALLAVLFVACLWISACGRSRAVTSLDMTISDFKFTPERFTVPAGEEITLNVDNLGLTSHQFVIFKLGTSPGENFDPDDEEQVYYLFEIKPGRDGVATFMAPTEPGEYQFICGIFGHLPAGMTGTLVVVENR